MAKQKKKVLINEEKDPSISDGYELKECSVVEEKIVCGGCGKDLGNIISKYTNVYKCKLDNKNYTSFVRRCSDKKCKTLSRYYIPSNLFFEKRRVFLPNEVEEIKSV